MTNVTLVYPYFRPPNDGSIFRFPPLGLGYIASYLKQWNITVDIVDCTFLTEEEAINKVRRAKPKIIGIQSMFSMKSKTIELANALKEDCDFLVAGGPLPTSNPGEFLNNFDAVIIGEGEETMLELTQQFENGGDLSKVNGIAYKKNGETKFTPRREFIKNLDSIPFPSRELFYNQSYKTFHLKKFGYKITPIMSSRGCPFNCSFCSRPVFGNTFRTRSPANIVDEVEEVIKLGYDRIWFADDCFTLVRKRLIDICNEIIDRKLSANWECLSRVDTIDKETLEKMRQAGCKRMFFGIESGNEKILSLMNKQISTNEAQDAVKLTKESQIEAGAFFIVGYPGESDETILDTVNFASSLPLDYLSFTLPYPIPGTPLYETVKNRMTVEDWEESSHRLLIGHKLLYRSDFSEFKLKFAIVKGTLQFELKKHLNHYGYEIVGRSFERLTNKIFKILR